MSDILRTQMNRLEARIQALEETNRAALDALELALAMDDDPPAANTLDDPTPVIVDTAARLRRLTPFKALCILLVDEETGDFLPAHLEPESARHVLQAEINSLVESRHFAWALKRRRPFIMLSRDKSEKLLIHALATSARTRGMFIGILEPGIEEIADVHLSVFSIILRTCACFIESYELYRLMRLPTGTSGRRPAPETADAARCRTRALAACCRERLTRQQTRLQLERKLRLLAEERAAMTGPDLSSEAIGFFRSSPAGRLLSASPGFFRLLGYPEAADAWEAVEDLPRAIYADPADRLQLIHELNARDVVEDFPVRFRRRNGGEFPARIACHAVREADGRLLYLEGQVSAPPLDDQAGQGY